MKKETEEKIYRLIKFLAKEKWFLIICMSTFAIIHSIFRTDAPELTKLSVCGTFLMFLATLIALRDSRIQHEDLYSQWEEDRKPFLDFSIVKYNHGYYLMIENYGYWKAMNISLCFNPEFIEKMDEKYRYILTNLCKRSFHIKGKSAKYFFIGWIKDLDRNWKGKHITLNISGKYNSGVINESIDMDEYIDIIDFQIEDNATLYLEKMANGVSSIANRSPVINSNNYQNQKKRSSKKRR